MSARALVTGAAGFIGQHLVARLARDGVDVLAMDIQAEPSAFSTIPNVEYITSDIVDLSTLKKELADVKVVYHLASKHLEVGIPDEEFRRVNVDALQTFLAACANAGVESFVYVSSVGVYGHVESPPASEDAPKKPVNIYEKTKLEAESVALTAAESGRFRVTIVRPSWVIGPGCPRTEKLLRSLRKGRFFYVGKGENLRHPIYVDDAVEGIILAGRSDKGKSGGVYNIAGPNWMPLREMVNGAARALGAKQPAIRIPRSFAFVTFWFAEMVFSLIGRSAPLSRRSLAFFENDNAFDISKAKQELSFYPRTDFLEAVRMVIAETAEQSP